MGVDVTNSAEYTEVLRQLNTWYGQDSQKIVNIINTYGLSPEQVTQDYLSGSGFEPWYTSSNGIAGYNTVGGVPVNSGAGSAAAQLNSNVGSTVQTGIKIPVETTYDGTTGKLTASNGLTSVATGAKSALTFITKDVLPAVNAAGLGIALGKTIDSALYNLNPDFWDNNGMSSLNPQTWNNITKDYPDGTLKKAFNTIFGLNPQTGETQMYLDADAAAYLSMYMASQGVFDPPESTYDIPDGGAPTLSAPYSAPFSGSGGLTWISGSYTNFVMDVSQPSAAFVFPSGGANSILFVSANTGSTEDLAFNGGFMSGTTPMKSPYYLNKFYTYHNKRVHYTYLLGNLKAGKEAEGGFNTISSANVTDQIATIAWLLAYGEVTEAGGVDGITDQDGATLPNFSGCSTPSDYLSALQTQYPDLFLGAVTQSVANPDGTTSTKTFIPIGTPSQNNNGNKTQPVTNTNNSGNKQNDTNANPNTLDLTGLENLIKQLTETLNQDGNPTDPKNPDPTGTGTTPPVVTPTGQASALFAVYNPSQSQLNSFGAWLWSSNFIDQVLKLFNNPMQAIIGLHKIFASPSISGTGNIRVGYLDSGVGANLVGAQYTTVDCGSVKLSEQFGNVFDYTDTHIRLYLPFIGIVDLDTADVMRGTVSVKYHVDVITGACLAEVKVSRDGSGGTLYQYAGDASVRYPISSGSYMGIVSGVLSAVGGIASAVMTGGATLPLAAGAVAGGISGAHTQVQHSGNFSGNAGAMGAKKPYLIIERPQTYITDGYESYQGIGENSVRAVANMSGYFKMMDAHLDSVNGATESELEEIKTALERGVIK